MPDSTDPQRSCAGCDACCTTMAVRELGKPPGRACVHLVGGGDGCSIWGAHPTSCRAFHCLWRSEPGVLPQRLFPPDCGFLLAIGDIDAWPLVVQVCVEDKRRHAWNTPENRALFSALAAAWNCVVTITGSDVQATHAFAPSGRVYSRTLRPDVFPQQGAVVAVPAADYDPDRRTPRQRMAEARFAAA